MEITAVDISYHRNGICGEGFHLVKFYYPKHDAHLMAAVFDTPNHVAVINPHDMNDHWRGDQFEPTLRALVGEFARRPF